MATTPTSVLHPIYRVALLPDGAGLTDGELLEGFVARREGAFFEVLVRRHGPMVFGVCQRILRNPHDAEDAFQATFLVLAQRAASVVPRELVGNWLHGVAYRTALEARRAAARRRRRERQVNNMPHPQIEAEETWQELLPLLDRELDRLPAKYRAAVVLCHLEGRTRKEAAAQIGLPIGTLSGRLTTAMRMLAKRMGRHGLALSGAALSAALTPEVASACVPPSLVACTAKAAPLLAAGQTAAASVVSAEVAALAKGVVKSMLLTKLKVAAVALLAVAAASGGTGAFAYHTYAAGRGEALQADRPESPPGPAASKLDDEEAKRPEVIQDASKKPEVEKSDKARLQGAWVPVASEVDGKKKSPDDPKLQRWNLRFDGDKLIMHKEQAVRYTLDPTKQPKEMDIMVKELISPLRAIYEFDGERLKLSYKKNGERPTEFDTNKNESVLIVFKRRNAP